jgi:hypothetical protein
LKKFPGPDGLKGRTAHELHRRPEIRPRYRSNGIISAARLDLLNASPLSVEFVMKPKRKKPPWWFAPLLVTGMAAVGGVLAIFMTLTQH